MPSAHKGNRKLLKHPNHSRYQHYFFFTSSFYCSLIIFVELRIILWLKHLKTQSNHQYIQKDQVYLYHFLHPSQTYMFFYPPLHQQLQKRVNHDNVKLKYKTFLLQYLSPGQEIEINQMLLLFNQVQFELSNYFSHKIASFVCIYTINLK